MSYIDALNQAAAPSTSDAKPGSNDEILGKQDFLTLLVAQLQNQDPLNPDDPTEFTAQLAQFSSLEQLFNLNDSMGSLSDSVTSSSKMASLETIGKEVAYEGNSINFDGNPVELGYMLDGYASDVQIVVEKNGTTIKVLEGREVTEGSHYLTWDGTNEAGQLVQPDQYKIIIQANAGEGESIAASPLIKSEVTGVDLEGSVGGTLITKAGQIDFTSILGVYDKPTSTTM